MELRLDEIGYWSEVKLDIVREYASAYSRILAAQSTPKLSHVYIDAFAGAGTNISRATGEFVLGSPLNALQVQPPFDEFHFIDVKRTRVAALAQERRERRNVHIYEGDCNLILLERVFPRVQWKDYRRGLCILDPYGLHLDWNVIQTAGGARSIDLFLNFPVMDMNRNVLWPDSGKVTPKQRQRLDRFWGDHSWLSAAYDGTGDLFGHKTKTDNLAVAGAFRDRLKAVARFTHVPEPLPMRNSRGSVVYYLFFASQKPVAAEIVTDIFNKYRNRM